MLVYFWAGYAGSDEVGQKVSWGVAIVLILILAIPLGFSFWQLLDQEKVERSIPDAILYLERSDIKIITNEINYASKPPLILIEAKGTKKITAAEVLALERELEKRLDRSFKVIFDLTISEQIESSEPEQEL